MKKILRLVGYVLRAIGHQDTQQPLVANHKEVQSLEQTFKEQGEGDQE